MKSQTRDDGATAHHTWLGQKIPYEISHTRDEGAPAHHTWLGPKILHEISHTPAHHTWLGPKILQTRDDGAPAHQNYHMKYHRQEMRGDSTRERHQISPVSLVPGVGGGGGGAGGRRRGEEGGGGGTGSIKRKRDHNALTLFTVFAIESLHTHAVVVERVS